MLRVLRRPRVEHIDHPEGPRTMPIPEMSGAFASECRVATFASVPQLDGLPLFIARKRCIPCALAQQQHKPVKEFRAFT